MRVLALLLSFVVFCIIAACYLGPIISKHKERSDAQAYQAESVLEGLDVKPADKCWPPEYCKEKKEK